MLDSAEVKKLVKALNQVTTNGANEEAVNILKKLDEGIVASEAFLKETKVGVAVGKLRTHENRGVSDLSKSIVKKWKGAVKANQGSEKGPAPAAAKKATKTEASPPVPPASSSSSSTPKPTTAQPAPPGAVSGAPLIRTHKTDGITFNLLHDPVRDKCMEMVYDALASDSGAPSEQILGRAKDIEASVHKEFGDTNANYKNKMRRLFLNLKEKSNPRLRESVVDGDIPVSRLVVMKSDEMASEERKAGNKALNDANLFKSLGAGEQEAETDAFKCGRCGQRKTRYRQAQTRSADEPMTTFVTCTHCGNRWKFS